MLVLPSLSADGDVLPGIPAPFAVFVAAGRSERLGRWVRFQTVELPKGAFA